MFRVVTGVGDSPFTKELDALLNSYPCKNNMVGDQVREMSLLKNMPLVDELMLLAIRPPQSAGTRNQVPSHIQSR